VGELKKVLQTKEAESRDKHKNLLGEGSFSQGKIQEEIHPKVETRGEKGRHFSLLLRVNEKMRGG